RAGECLTVWPGLDGRHRSRVHRRVAAAPDGCRISSLRGARKIVALAVPAGYGPMQQPWRFVDTGAGDAASNMALDEALLVRHEAGATPPTLRVYGWGQPTVSLRYAQNVQQEVDLAACHAQGVAVVRRPTGGRAVLHDQEVTYSVVMPLALEDGPHTITEHYRRIGTALAAALQALGLPVHLARPQVRTASTRA